MIGNLPVGTLPRIVISAVSHEGLSVTVDGRPGMLAILDEHGAIVAHGPDVAREAEAVAVNSHRNMLQGQGYLRVLGNPLPPDPAG